MKFAEQQYMIKKIKDFEMPFSELRVLSEEGAWMLTVNEPDKWNVVSLWASVYNPEGGRIEKIKPEFKKAKRLCQENFDDITHKEEGFTLCDQEHLKRIIEFGHQVRGEPLLVHCHAGISRSTAVAVLLVLDAIKDISKNPFEDALDIVYRVRPIMLPNNHILNIGLPLIAKDEWQVMTWYREAYNSGVMRKIKGG